MLKKRFGLSAVLLKMVLIFKQNPRGMSYEKKNLTDEILDRNVSQHMNSIFLKLLDSTLMTTAYSMMQKNDKDEIIVVNKNDTPIGIVTDQDILQKIGEAHANPNKTRLDDIMSFPLIGVKHNDTLSKALGVMRNNNLKKLAAIGNDGKIIGMIYHHTITNLIQQKSSIYVVYKLYTSSNFVESWNRDPVCRNSYAYSIITGYWSQ